MPDLLTDVSQDVSVLLGQLRAGTDQDLVDTLEAAEQAVRAATAKRALAVDGLAARIEAVNGAQALGVTDEIAVMLAISSRSADRLVGAAQELTARPVVWAALRDGLIDATKAGQIVTLLDGFTDPQRADLERAAIAHGTFHTAHELKRRLLRMTCDEDPDQTLRREAIDRRHVAVTPAGHGMAHIHGYVSAEVAATFIAALDQLAAQPGLPDPYRGGQDRSAEQRRADALAGFLMDHAFWDIHVNVTIPADMLLGVETAGADLNGSPVTHQLALRIAWSPDARWTRLVTDPLTGTLLDAGTRKYAIPPRLRNAIRLRDRHCQFPGCTMPAEYTDTDHTTPWPAGPTTPDNLHCLCRRHHRIKTFTKWKVRKGPRRDLTWQTPLGTTRTTHPWNYRPRP